MVRLHLTQDNACRHKASRPVGCSNTHEMTGFEKIQLGFKPF